MHLEKRPKPWRHQAQAETAITQAFRNGEATALMVMATGLGKNLTAALAFERFRRSRLQRGERSRLLFLAHQTDIVDQARATFELVFGARMTFGSFNGHVKQTRVDAVFATFKSMDLALFAKRRGKQRQFGPRGFDYIIVDESHHSHARTFRRVIQYFQPRFLLGMTATPDRADLQDIREIYGQEVFSLPLEKGLARGLLAPVDYRLVTDGIENLGILDTPVGKLSISRLNKVLFVPKRDQEIARIIQRHMRRVQNPHVMIFCPSIGHCSRMEQGFPDAIAIHSRLRSDEQALRLQRFRRGECNVALTVDKFNEGIDIPEANLIVFLRSTASRTIFLQQLGRGLRKQRGKSRVLVLDFAGNCERLQMVHTLWQAVRVNRGGGKGKTPRTVSVDVGTMRFSQTARKITQVLERIKEGYTEVALINQLKRLRRKLGRVPTTGDINEASKKGHCASRTVYGRVFGSIPEARKAAGMTLPGEANPDRIIPARLVKQLKQLKQQLGRTPQWADINEAYKRGESPSVHDFRRAFGSLASAILAAEMLPTRSRGLSDSEMLKVLRDLGQRIKRIPSWRDVANAQSEGLCFSPETYSSRFDSFDVARRKAWPPVKNRAAHRKK